MDEASFFAGLSQPRKKTKESKNRAFCFPSLKKATTAFFNILLGEASPPVRITASSRWTLPFGTTWIDV
jgi:hypothetical protein